jgi:hypothetical protein
MSAFKSSFSKASVMESLKESHLSESWQILFSGVKCWIFNSEIYFINKFEEKQVLLQLIVVD